MPLDSVFLTCLTRELAKSLVGARIDKVSMPSRDSVVLSVHGSCGDNRLMISALSGAPRMGFTAQKPENPAVPPMFCMFLRKHLIGARIVSVTQPPFERLVTMELDGTDALGDPVRKTLICELMGRYANLILTDGDGIVLDCLRRIDGDMSDKRLVLPGLRYYLPPSPDRLTPDGLDAETCRTLLDNAPAGIPLEKLLSRNVGGLSPLLCREMAARAYGDPGMEAAAALTEDGGAALSREVLRLTEAMEAGTLEPTMVLEEGNPWDLTVLPITQYGALRQSVRAESFSALVDEFYARRELRERMRQKSLSLLRTAKNARDRTRRRLAAQKQELLETENREEKRICGELLTANLYRLRRGEKSVTVEDYYTGSMRTIPLDPTRTPQQNAAKYYKDYTKAKTAANMLTGLIASGETELEYLESVLDELERAESEKELGEIRAELIAAGYEKLKKGEKQRSAPSAPLVFHATDGSMIRVGRSNVQNDRLTLKESSKTDLWLHAQKLHGSHVIVSAGGVFPSEETIREAAVLAAVYSQGQDSSTVPVDYTLVKYVKKPAGGKPGMVIYTDYKTILVRPDRGIQKKLGGT